MTDMTNHTTLRACDLKALLRIAGAEDTRYYLCGVQFESDGHAGVAVATDGFALLALRCEPFLGASFVVPRAALQQAVSKSSRPKNPVEIHPGKLVYTARTGTTELPYTPIDANYPDWRRTVPARCSGEPAVYDCRILERLRLAFEDFDQDKDRRGYCFVTQNGKHAGIVRTGPDKLAIVMSMREGASNWDAAAHAQQFIKVQA